MDFSRGYAASFYGTIVNPDTMKDAERFEIINGSINRSTDILRQSASITISDSADYFNDAIIRIYMIAVQDGKSETIPLFTGLASSPSESYSNGVITSSLECYSLLKIVDDIVLPLGWYASAYSNGPETIKDLLSPLSVDVYISGANVTDFEEGTFPDYILTSSIVAEGGETNLTMIDKILSIIDWRMQIDGDGSIYLSSADPDSMAPVAVISATENDVIETNFTRSRDWFSCPNVFKAIYGDFTAIERDDDPDSELSTVNRGREVWMVEDSASLEEDESLGEYAKRRLMEEQERSETVSYTRRFMPEINQDDIVRINYPELQGDYYVESQSINLEANAKTSENVYRYI